MASALGAARQAISAMDEAVRWLMAVVHYYGLKVGQAAEVLGLDEDLAVKLNEEVVLETHGAMLGAPT